MTDAAKQRGRGGQAQMAKARRRNLTRLRRSRPRDPRCRSCGSTSDDVAAGERLLALAPPGVANVIRRGGYRRSQYTDELVAETYALLMSRRRRGQRGQPAWLADEIFDLVRRVSGWSD